MNTIAFKNLFQEKLRFAINVTGVAIAITLILILNGFLAGMNRQITAYLDNTPVDLLIAQKKLRNFLGSSSIVPLSAIPKIEKTKGVKKVIPVFNFYAVLDIGKRKQFSLIVGFDPKIGGGPWKMVSGRSNIGDDDVIVDQFIAGRYGLDLGDKVKIKGKDFTIAGLSGGTSTWMTGTFFITLNAASHLLSTQNVTNFLLVSLADKSKLNEIGKAISQKLPDLSVTSKEKASENDVALFAGVFSGPLRLMVTIAFLIGVLLVGSTIYTATVDRAKEYGVLKAVGMKNWKLYLVVFIQALISSLCGFFLGIPLYYGTKAIIDIFVPQFLILIDTSFLLLVFLASLLMSILASYLPVRAVAKIDPAIAFKRGA